MLSSTIPLHPSCVLGLREYALTSGLNDSRFAPITKEEFPRLTVAVNILHVSRKQSN